MGAGSLGLSDMDTLLGLVKKTGLCREGEAPVIEPFPGGVSCLVARVRTQEGTWVVKQALPRLRVKDEWHAPRERSSTEVASLRLIREIVQGNPAPRVILEDSEDFAFVMEYAGDGCRNWKQDLLGGLIDNRVTRTVASIMADLHSKTWLQERVEKRFGDMTNFEQLRIDAYLTTIARRHPGVKAQVEEIISFLRTERLCLVHGDFSPKNILLLQDGRTWVIDSETAHCGNPVFDIAFCTNHLILKGIHLKSPAHLDEARALWSEYWNASASGDLEREGVLTLAALMLARIDGKSPVEYLKDDERKTVQTMSYAFVQSREESFSSIVDAARASASGEAAVK